MRQKTVEKLIEELKNKKIDMLVRTLPFKGGAAYICYIGQLVDRQAISELVIRPLLKYITEEKKPVDAAFAADNLIYADECKISENLDEAEYHILKGMTVIFFSRKKQYLIINRKKVERRNVESPQLKYTARGPRDCFVEDLDTNLSLLRYRIKDRNIRIEKLIVGARTKSTVAVVYIEDIANPQAVNEVIKRINAVHTDGVYETGELQGFLLNTRRGLFPNMGIVERSDMAVENLLEGKVVVLVDGSCIALHAPLTFPEFFYACDDRYENRYYGMFMRILRYLALPLSFTLTAVYVAITEFHPDALPASFIVTLAQMRSRAPVTAFVAVIIVEILVELIREALLRVPVKIGSAIAIVGAIIIGQAASTSGVFTSLLLILVSVSFLASFAVTDFTLMNPFRILKFFVILATGMFGFYGFSLALTTILINLVSINSFGVPYMAPYAPYNTYDFLRSLLFKKDLSPKRMQYLRNRDDTRAPEAEVKKGRRGKDNDKQNLQKNAGGNKKTSKHEKDRRK